MTDTPRTAVAGAEQIVLGTAMEYPDAIEPITLRSGDFYEPKHGTIYAVITGLWAANLPTGPVAVADRLEADGQLERVGGLPYLHTLITNVLPAASLAHYADIVASAARDREREADAARLTQAAGDREKFEAILAEINARREDSPAGERAVRPPLELDAFLATDDPEYDWLIPGLIERGDRVILTGEEGQGKSTLLRQIAVQAASGVHPFGGDDFDPLTVLWVQLENGARHERREFRALRLAAGTRYMPGLLHVEIRPAGIDLLDSDDGAWLLALAAAVRPDMLITGPLYKLANGDPTEERTAKAASMWLDRVRRDTSCSLILEGHVPYGANGKRPERPYGASLWSRWPEFGIFLARDGMLRHWRGQRDEREWPAALQRGGQWPWSPVTRPRDLLWAQIKSLCLEAGDQIAYRDLAKLTGSSLTNVSRAIGEHKTEWDKIASAQVAGGGTE